MNYSGAGVVVIERYNNKNAFYIVREKNGIWSIPGGKRDRYDNTYYTAYKELKEESKGLFSISPDILKTCYSYDLKAGNNMYYKAYFIYITSTIPIFRKYYYNNKKIIDDNSQLGRILFPYHETDKIDRIYIDTFIADLPNIQPDGSMITHKVSNGEQIVLRGRDVSIIKHNIKVINSMQSNNIGNLRFTNNNTINGITGFHTFYL
jgi:hypothetical protein